LVPTSGKYPALATTPVPRAPDRQRRRHCDFRGAGRLSFYWRSTLVLGEIGNLHTHKDETARPVQGRALIAIARATPTGATFEHGGRGYRRILAKVYETTFYRDGTPAVLLEDLGTGPWTQRSR
jgi:hypothetical protein